MAKTVADGLWEMLVAAGVRRCYGIVGDALNPVIDALRRNGSVDFVHVRHEEYGAFAAVADARLTGQPVAVCGTAGPGVVHLVNGLLDARKEGAPVIAVAGDVETSALDSDTVEELNPVRDRLRQPGLQPCRRSARCQRHPHRRTRRRTRRPAGRAQP